MFCSFEVQSLLSVQRLTTSDSLKHTHLFTFVNNLYKQKKNISYKKWKVFLCVSYQFLFRTITRWYHTAGLVLSYQLGGHPVTCTCCSCCTFPTLSPPARGREGVRVGRDPHITDTCCCFLSGLTPDDMCVYLGPC